MTRWQHTYTELHKPPSNTLHAHLHEMSEAGWEMVNGTSAITVVSDSYHSTQQYMIYGFFWKRPN